MPTAIAINKGNIVELSWTTVSEKNNDYFILEQSVDGVAFKTISQQKGQGNAEQTHCYRFKAESLGEINYFRLQQTDRDKRSGRSEIISVPSCHSYRRITLTNDGTGTIRILLNPSAAQALQLYVHDVLGSLVQVETIHVHPEAVEYSVPLKEELKGVYSVSLYAPGEKLAEKKIMVRTN